MPPNFIKTASNYHSTLPSSNIRLTTNKEDHFVRFEYIYFQLFFRSTDTNKVNVTRLTMNDGNGGLVAYQNKDWIIYFEHSK